MILRASSATLTANIGGSSEQPTPEPPIYPAEQTGSYSILLVGAGLAAAIGMIFYFGGKKDGNT